MKQLRNIVAPIFLLCLMAVASLPALAQEQQDVYKRQADREGYSTFSGCRPLIL